MASGKSDYRISELPNQIFSATAYSFPVRGTWPLATSNAHRGVDWCDVGGGVYTGYARVTVTASGMNFTTLSAGLNVQNATAITFPLNAGVTLPTITYFSISTAPHRGAEILYWGSISSTTINPGDTPQVNVPGLTVTEALGRWRVPGGGGGGGGALRTYHARGADAGPDRLADRDGVGGRQELFTGARADHLSSRGTCRWR